LPQRRVLLFLNMINFLFASVFLTVSWLFLKELKKFRSLRPGDYPEKAEISAATEQLLAALYKNVLFSFLLLFFFMFVFYLAFRFSGVDAGLYADSMFYFSSGFAGFAFFASLLFMAPTLLLRLNYPFLGSSAKDARDFFLKNSLYVCLLFSLFSAYFVYAFFSLSGGRDPDFARDISAKMPLLWAGAVFSAFIIFSNFKLYSFAFLQKGDSYREFLLRNIDSFSGNAFYLLTVFLVSVSFMIGGFLFSSYGINLMLFGFVSLLAGIAALLLSFLALFRRWKGEFSGERFLGLFELSMAVYLVFMLVAVQQFFNSNMWFFLSVVCGVFSSYLLLFARNHYSEKIKALAVPDSPSQKEFIFPALKILTESSSGFLFIFALFAVSSYYCGIKANGAVLSDFISGFAGINAAFIGFISVSFYLFFVSFLNSSAVALEKFMVFSRDKAGAADLQGLTALAAETGFHSVNFFPGFTLLAGFMSVVSYVFYFRFMTGYQADFQFGFNIDYIMAILISAAFSFSITSLFVSFLSFLENKTGFAAARPGFLKNPFASSALLIICLFLVFSLLLFTVKHISRLLPQIVFSIFFIFAILNVSIAIVAQGAVDMAAGGKNLRISEKVSDYLEAYKFYLLYIILFFSVLLIVLTPVLI